MTAWAPVFHCPRSRRSLAILNYEAYRALACKSPSEFSTMLPSKSW